MTPITKMVLRFIKENLDSNNQIKISNYKIAQELGVHEVSVSRCIGLLRQQGVIVIENGGSTKRTITLL
ncbi:MAG: helix-turn-helix domain-containing protein [Melioribacteraceae bacterium]